MQSGQWRWGLLLTLVAISAMTFITANLHFGIRRSALPIFDFNRHFTNSDDGLTWFIGTISATQSSARRQIIRDTWQRRYKGKSQATTRFILSNPPADWASEIKVENATFGDLIVLPHIEETEDIANSVKSVEMLKFLSAQSQRWRFVTKIDDDSYFDADRFYKAYLEPLLEGRVATTRTIIARTLAFDGFTYTYPGGQFYTMTWDLVPLLASLHEKDPIPDEYEDVLVGRLLFEAGESWTHTDLNNHLAFDYDGNFTRGDGTAWASNVTQLDEWSHAVGPGAINPHKMKEDETYLQVAACYDENGLKMDEWKARL